MLQELFTIEVNGKTQGGLNTSASNCSSFLCQNMIFSYLSKLEHVTTGFFSLSDVQMSLLTCGVAVAVKAMIGTLSKNTYMQCDTKLMFQTTVLK